MMMTISPSADAPVDRTRLLDQCVFFNVTGLTVPLYLAIWISQDGPQEYGVIVRVLDDKSFKIISRQPGYQSPEELTSDPVYYMANDPSEVYDLLVSDLQRPDKTLYQKLEGAFRTRGLYKPYDKQFAEPVRAFLSRRGRR